MVRKFWLGLLLCLILAGWLGHFTPEVRAQSGSAAEILQLVNQVRAEHGLPPYQYNATLSIAAQNHANWMAANVAYSHTGAGGTSPQDRANAAGYNGYVAENIVGGMNMTPRQGVSWWRNSSLHYSMMVSNRYAEAGVGVATNGTQNMYVLVMGRPRVGAAAPEPESNEPQSEPLMVTPIELAQPREDGSIVHVVQEGQALWQIAAHYEAELRDLLVYNGLDEDDYLQPGDEIIVQLADNAPPPPTPTPPLAHVVREGENAWIIAKRYQIELATFFYLNNLNEDSVLHPGNEVKIRLAEGEAPPPTPTPKLTHVIKEGDTAWSIALQNGITLEELIAFNGIDENTVLQVGAELYVRATPPPEPTATPEVMPTATLQAEQTQTVALAAAATPIPTDTPAPAATTAPTVVATRANDSGESEDGNLLYIMSLLAAGAGLLVFLGVVLRRNG